MPVNCLYRLFGPLARYGKSRLVCKGRESPFEESRHPQQLLQLKRPANNSVSNGGGEDFYGVVQRCL